MSSSIWQMLLPGAVTFNVRYASDWPRVCVTQSVRDNAEWDGMNGARRLRRFRDFIRL
jgi:hypothetical protein